MQDDLGWSRLTLTGAYSLAILTAGLASVAAGRLLDRHSPRLPMSVGSALAALFVVAWSRISTVPELYAVFLGLGAAMAFVLYEAAFVVLTKWFSVRRTAALATLTTIGASASFIFSPLSEALVHAYGWRFAVGALAFILAVITIPLHALVLRAAPSPQPPASGSPAAVVTTRRAVIRRSSFWMIGAAFATSSFVAAAIAVHLVSLLIDAGIRPAASALAAGLLGLAQIGGRVMFARARRLLPPAAHAAVAFGLAAVTLGLLAVARTSGLVVLLFVLCFGASSGMFVLLRATLIADLYGRTNYGAIAGVLSACTLGGTAAAPLGASLIALAPGGDATMLLALAALLVFASLAVGKAMEREYVFLRRRS